MSSKTTTPRYCTVRLSPDDFTKLDQLRAIVTRSGWAAIGSTRSTRITLGSITAEAVGQVLAAATKKR